MADRWVRATTDAGGHYGCPYAYGILPKVIRMEDCVAPTVEVECQQLVCGKYMTTDY
jgi:hypothetical protein